MQRCRALRAGRRGHRRRGLESRRRDYRLGGAGQLGIARHRQLSDEIRDGRYARWSTLPVKGSEAEVYDGQSLWARDISGGVHPYDSWYPRARAVTEAFLTRRGYLDPHSGAAMTCVGFTGSDADRAEMVRVAPRGRHSRRRGR